MDDIRVVACSLQPQRVAVCLFSVGGYHDKMNQTYTQEVPWHLGDSLAKMVVNVEHGTRGFDVCSRCGRNGVKAVLGMCSPCHITEARGQREKKWRSEQREMELK